MYNLRQIKWKKFQGWDEGPKIYLQIYFNIIIHNFYCSAQSIQDRKLSIEHIQHLLKVYDIHVPRTELC
jgi:hypothetical protein